MITYILLRYAHFLSIFILVSSIVAEHLLLKPQMSRREIRRLSIIDAVYGISALLVVGIGLTLWFGGGKPAEFYSKNFLFHTKVGLFVLMAILSIYPTIFFLKNRKGESLEEIVEMPKMIVMLVRLELLLIVVIPLLATLMAQGVGRFG